MRSTATLIFLFVTVFFAKAQPCSDLFISEYEEGSSFNKVIEIYNPTTAAVSMDGYQLLLYSNGSDTAGFKFKLHGTLGSHQVYVIAHPQADPTLVIPLADTTSLVCNWNGNDAVALVNNNLGDTLDIVGVIGENPGTEWEVSNGGTTKDHSLIRTPETQEGTTDWAVCSQQWLSLAQNDFSNIGIHTVNMCPAVSPSVSISVDSTSVPESIGTVNIKISILNPNTAATSIDVKATGGTAMQGDDYLFMNQTVTFPANSGSPVILPVTIVNDGISEPDESIELSLQNPTNGASIGVVTITVKIIDDDGLGIPGINNSGITVFPNPVHNELHIQSASLIEEVVLENVMGQILLHQQRINSSNLQFDLGNVPGGIYMIKVKSQNGMLTKQLIKQE